MYRNLVLLFLVCCTMAHLSHATRLIELETSIPELPGQFDPAWLSKLYQRVNEESKWPPEALMNQHFWNNADVKKFVESMNDLVVDRLAELEHDQDWTRGVEELLLTRDTNETWNDPELSKVCMSKVQFFFDAIPKLAQNGWVLAVLDSLGKPPSGIFQQILPGSSLQWVGEYRQCEALNGTDINGTLVWKGQYCSLTLQPVRIGICVPRECKSGEIVVVINRGIKLLLTGFGGVVDNVSEQLNQFLVAAGKLPLSLIIATNPTLKALVEFLKGTVVPIVAQAQSFNISNVDFRIANKSIDCLNEQEELTGGAITAIVVIAILAVLVLISSLVDTFISFLPDSDYKQQENDDDQHQLKINHDQEDAKNGTIESMQLMDHELFKKIELKKSIQNNLIIQLLLSFSIVTNTRKIFKITKSKDQLDCLNGIRFLSISWVVLGHTYLISMSYASNPVRGIRIFQSPLFQIVLSGYLSVDSFFLLSGLLNAYLFLKETQKQKITPKLVGMYYFHRIWRLTPPLALVIMTATTLTPYLAKGPLYPKAGFASNCHNIWWANLLYLNNFIYTGPTERCLGVSWYLANDFQFYAFALGILVMFYYGKKNWAMKVGAYGVCLFLACSQVLITGFVMNYESDVDPLDVTSNWFEKVYIKPYHRWSPYVVGLALGNLILEHRDKVRIPKLVNFFLHLVSFTLMGLVVFGQYRNYNPAAGGSLSHEETVLYNATFRLAWSIALGYIIYACVMNRTRFINSFLSHEFWIPLSRLTFMIYLIHYDVIGYLLASSEKPLYFENNTLAIYFCGILMICTPMAYVFCMLFESPWVSLERVIFRKTKKNH